MRREDLPRPPRVLHAHYTPLPLGEEISRTEALRLVHVKTNTEQGKTVPELLNSNHPLRTTYKCFRTAISWIKTWAPIEKGPSIVP